MESEAETAADRVERLRHWCVTGRRPAAALELSAWVRSDACPPAARVLWASLLLQRGETEAALDALATAGQQPGVCRMRAAVLVRLGRQEAAHAEWAAARAPVQAAAAVPTRSADLSRDVPDAEADHTDAHTAEANSASPPLASVLLRRPGLIPTLVAAARISRRSGWILALRDACVDAAQAMDGASDPAHRLLASRGAAQLSMRLGDDTAARRWARVALALAPCDAAAALVLSWTADDACGESSAEVLGRVAAAHPDYPDVAAALQRCRSAAPAQAA